MDVSSLMFTETMNDKYSSHNRSVGRNEFGKVKFDSFLFGRDVLPDNLIINKIFRILDKFGSPKCPEIC